MPPKRAKFVFSVLLWYIPKLKKSSCKKEYISQENISRLFESRNSFFINRTASKARIYNNHGHCYFIRDDEIEQFYLFIYLWLCWVFVSVRGLSLVVASGGHSSSRCAGLSLSRPLLLWSTGSRRAGSAIVAHGPSRSATCGIFPDQGSNPCPLHWQADSQPLRHEGSPRD